MQRLWYCFHADCNVSGRTGITLTKEHAARTLRGSQALTPAPSRTSNTYEVPDTFVSLSRSLDAELYVKRVQAYDAYLSGRADIRYDFKRNRAVFLIKDGNKVVDAAGRSLDGRNPKWYRYGSSKSPFVSGASLSVACVVEDCASACSISGVVTGVAILGTNLLSEHIGVLKQYDRVFVALDKDATDKAITMVRALHTHVPTKLMVLRTDLKNMQKDERDDFLRSYIDR
jgi:DNA primase